MRIAYVFAGADLKSGSGVGKKITAQTRAWTAAGHEAALFLHAHHRGALTDDGDQAGVPIQLFVDTPITARSATVAIRKRLQTMRRLAASVFRWQPDLIYLRYTVYYPALKALVSRIPAAFEINTDDLGEYRILLPPYKYLYHRLTRGALLKRARGMVFIAGELATTSHYARYGRPALVLGNAIDLSQHCPLPVPNQSRRRLVFVGAPGCPWHGVDKIVTLARSCPDWDFDVVGDSEAGTVGDLPGNLRFHGYLERVRYEQILARADVALGTLALHRKGMSENSPLKVREYLAFGIPTIIAYRDTDFLDGCDFILELPNTPDNVVTHLQTIRAFVNRVTGRRVPRASIAHLDTAPKEQRRLEFLEQVMGDAGRERAPKKWYARLA